MAQDWYGRALIGSELTGVTTYQPFKTNENVQLKAIKILVMLYDSPSIINLTAKIYSDRSGTPLKLLHSSTTQWQFAGISNQPNALREIYFEFNDVSLQEATQYQLVFQADSYNGTDASHMALMTYFPDNLYTTGITVNQTKLSTMPIHLALIGAVV